MKEIQPQELRNRLKNRDFVLLDVREPEENKLVKLPKSLHIPLMELPSRTDEISAAMDGRECDIVVYCRVGQRSQIAIEWLEELGFSRLINLRGGINAYALEADTKLTPY